MSCIFLFFSHIQPSCFPFLFVRDQEGVYQLSYRRWGSSAVEYELNMNNRMDRDREEKWLPCLLVSLFSACLFMVGGQQGFFRMHIPGSTWIHWALNECSGSKSCEQMTPRPRSNLTCPVLPVVWQTVTYVGVLFSFGNVANDNWKCTNKLSWGYSHNRENGNYRLGTNYCQSAQWTCDLVPF